MGHRRLRAESAGWRRRPRRQTAAGLHFKNRARSAETAATAQAGSWFRSLPGEKQKIPVAFHPELVVRNGFGIGVVQIAVSQQEHAGISEASKKLKDMLCSRIGHRALELHDRPVASHGLLAAQKNVQFVAFYIAFDEFQIRKCFLGHGVEPSDLHVECRIRCCDDARARASRFRRRFFAGIGSCLPSEFDSATFITRRLRPIKSRFLTFDAVAHLRLRFECDHAA